MKNNKGRAIALGYFDGLHLGHIEVIKTMLTRTDLEAAVFTFSARTPLPKMQKPLNIITDDQKIRLMEDMGVQKIYAWDFAEIRGLSPEEFVDKILVAEMGARALFCGSDFHFGKNGAGTPDVLARFAQERNVTLTVVPIVEHDGKPVSSSLIRQAIECGDIKTANTLLGYALMYELTVVEGEKLGRALGAPTINQVFPAGCVVPRFGVYSGWTEVGGHQYRSITNIGLKPTVQSTENALPLLETHIIGFSGDLYGENVRVALCDFLREERRFGSVEELKAQIHFDIKRTLQEKLA